MSGINRQPTGLLGFLGIKNGGVNPQDLATTVAPTWDLAQQYLQTNTEFFSVGGTISALGYNTGFASSASEVTYVHAFGIITSTLAAGNSLGCAIEIADQNGITGVIVPEISARVSQPTERLVLGLQNPVILSPGQQIGFYVWAFAGANIPYVASIRVSRMPA